jgi:hypothetical protein
LVHGLAAEFLDVGATDPRSSRTFAGVQEKANLAVLYFQISIVLISSVPTSNVWNHRRDDKLGFMTPPPKTRLHEMLRRLQFILRQYGRIHGSGQWTSVQ